MRKFQVSVNGNTYEVEVEEIGGGASSISTPVAPVAAVAAPKKSAPAVATTQGSTKIVVPMPGKIVDVKVSVGQTVKEGELVAILEAMKMENEIFSTGTGTVVSVNVSAGAAVETNDVIVTLN